MILPTKHLSHNRAILGIGAEILGHLEKPATVSSVWERFNASPKSYVSYDWFVLGLDFLFLIDAIRIEAGLVTLSKTGK